MVYEPLCHDQEKAKCLLVVLAKRNQQEKALSLDCFNKTIIPLALVSQQDA